jgi:hypothetical protein
MIFRELDGSFYWDGDGDHEALVADMVELVEMLADEGLSDAEIDVAVKAMLEAKRKGMLN